MLPPPLPLLPPTRPGHPARRLRAAPAALRVSTHLLCALLVAAGSVAARAAPAPVALPAGCQQPLDVLEEAAREAPADPHALAALGRCQLARGLAPDALASFAAARGLDDTPLRRLEEAVAAYHAREVERAARLLDGIAAQVGDRPEFHFYRGMILLERGRREAAAARLDHARRLAPSSVEPVASYYAGIAWSRSGDRAHAVEALERIEHDWPGTSWAQAAGRELARLRGRSRSRAWLDAEVGGEYDTNVRLAGRGIEVPAEISDKTDWRGAWQARGGVERRGDSRYTGIAAGYVGSEHSELDDFDVHYPNLTLYGAQRLSQRNWLRLQYDGGHAWVGRDPFVWTHDLEATLYHDHGALGTSELFASGQYRDYRRTGVDAMGRALHRLDRDGGGLRVGIAQHLPVAPLEGGLRLHYAFGFYDAKGREFTFRAHEVGLRTHLALPWQTRLAADIRYTARLFEGPSVFDTRPGPHDRRDDEVELGAEVEHELGADVSLAARVRYERRASNVQVYDYSRVITGVFARYRFGRD